MVRHRLALGAVVSGLLALGASAPTEPQCPSDSQIVFEVQPFKIICGQETQTLMITKTYTVPFGPDNTGSNNTPDQPGSPGSPPGPVTKTVYEVCEDCPNTRIPPAPDCTECVVTIVTTRPPPSSPTPSLTTITTGCAADVTDCKATTIPPSPDCTGICTATVITTPPPGLTTTITTGCATDVTDCEAITIPPASDCTGICTATVITPPPTSDPATTSPPPGTTTTITTGCATDVTDCEATTIPPASDCTGVCTATVITTPPPVTTTTVTTGCATDVTECEATTIPPASDCTGVCTATVITPPPTSNPATTTSPPPGTTATITTGCATDVTDCEATTIPPASDCTGVCTATVITTPPPVTTTTVTTGCAADVADCEATTIPPASDCTSICTATVITTPSPTPEPSSTSSDEPSSTTSEEPTTSTPPAFSCDAGGYLVQQRTLYRLNLDTGDNPTVKDNIYTGPAGGNINAMGYNILDDYLYGIVSGIPRLIRIAANGDSTVWPLSGLPEASGAYNVGDFDSEGNLWASRNGEQWAKIDLRPGSSTFGTVVDSGTAVNPGLTVSDWARVRGGGNYFYTVSRVDSTGGQAVLQRFSLDTQTWETLAEYGQLGGSNNFGGLYPAGNGIMYGSENTSGGIWRFDVLNPEAEPTLVTDGPISFSNDGARCIDAPDPESAADPTK